MIHGLLELELLAMGKNGGLPRLLMSPDCLVELNIGLQALHIRVRYNEGLSPVWQCAWERLAMPQSTELFRSSRGCEVHKGIAAPTVLSGAVGYVQEVDVRVLRKPTLREISLCALRWQILHQKCCYFRHNRGLE